MGSRKDDPVFNVKFVQLVESKPCLWNSTLPEYSKKDEIQKAWQEVANETKDTVRNCRERWRTIRSSFLRSLKLSRTSTGRGKRKYYLSKYLQFLIPFTRSRLKNSATIIAQRKTAAAGNIPPMTHISNMPIVSSDETKDSSNSAEVAAIADGDVMVTLHEGAVVGTFPMAQHAALPLPLPLPLPLNLQTIKQEKDILSGNLGGGNMTQIVPLQRPPSTFDQQNLHVNSSLGEAVNMSIVANNGNSNSNTNNINDSNNNNNNNNNKNNLSNNINNVNLINSNNSSSSSNKLNTINTNINNNNNSMNTCNNSILSDNSMLSNNNNNSSSTSSNNNKLNITKHSPSTSMYSPHPPEIHNASTVDLKEFADWIKIKNEHQRHCLMTTTSSPDADQSFLNSLHPYLREMSGKQNRRFRQKVVALIDAVLDNTD